MGDHSGALCRRVRHHHPWSALCRRHHPADCGDLLPLFLRARRQRLFPPSGAAGRPPLQENRPDRTGGYSDGARFRLRYHGNHGHPYSGNGAGADSGDTAAGACHPLFGPARGDTGAAVESTRSAARLESLPVADLSRGRLSWPPGCCRERRRCFTWSCRR